MKFRNVSDDDRDVPAHGITVAPGETTPDLPPEESEGFVGQVEVWKAVGRKGQDAQNDVVTEQHPAPDAVADSEGAV